MDDKYDRMKVSVDGVLNGVTLIGVPASQGIYDWILSSRHVC